MYIFYVHKGKIYPEIIYLDMYIFHMYKGDFMRNKFI